MSFFADMLAGAAGGVGRGMVEYGTAMEREERERKAAEEKAALALELQRQRAEDKAADRELRAEMFNARYGEGGGSGSGGSGGSSKGINLREMMLNEEDPAKQQKYIRRAALEGGPDAAAALADYYGKPLQEKSQEAVPEDVERIKNNPMLQRQGAAPETREVSRDMKYDSNKGSMALNRMLVRAQDAGKYDDYAKGEARTVGTDAVLDAKDDAGLRGAGAVNMALEGKDRFGVSDGTQYDKAGVEKSTTTEVGKSKIRENDAQAGKASRSSAGKAAVADKLTTEKNAALRERSSYVSQLKDAGRDAKPLIQAKIDRVDADLERLNRLLADARSDSPSSSTAPAPAVERYELKDGKLVRVKG